MLLTIPFFCVACGTYQLAGEIKDPSRRTTQEQQTDVLICKDKAHTSANSTEQQVKGALLSATIVGLPIAYSSEKAKSREVFAECMTERGYAVAPAEEVKPKQDEEVSTSKPDEANRLEKIKALRERGLISEDEYNEKKKEILSNM